jgi:hypothetical protein
MQVFVDPGAGRPWIAVSIAAKPRDRHERAARFKFHNITNLKFGSHKSLFQ